MHCGYLADRVVYRLDDLGLVTVVAHKLYLLFAPDAEVRFCRRPVDTVY